MCLGLPGRVVEVTDPDKKIGTVDIDGDLRCVNLACVASNPEEARGLVGSWVMVHLGFAMQRVSVEEAEASRSLLLEIEAAMRRGA